MQGGLNIAFAGTPELAAAILKHLQNDGRHSIAFVLTRPDRPAGRGKRIKKSPVKLLAEENNLPLFQPGNRHELEMLPDLKGIDLLVVAAYGMILTEKVLKQPKFGCINVHTSLLPRWRGAAPIQHAILSGDKETGITIMQMDAGLDTGDILYQETCPIDKNDTAGTLHDKLADIGGKCLLITLDMLRTERLTPRAQDESQATYAAKINKQDGEIDWLKPALEIERLVRAMNPAPVAYTELNGKTLRIWEAEVLEIETHNARPGTIINYSPENLDIVAGKGAVRIHKLQMPGKKILGYRDFYNGNPGILTGTS
jgi:methionyl-tRNA formyltransferase